MAQTRAPLAPGQVHEVVAETRELSVLSIPPKSRRGGGVPAFREPAVIPE